MLFCKDEKHHRLADYVRWFGPFGAIFTAYFVFMQFLGSHQGYPWFDHDWGLKLLEMARFRVPHHLLLLASARVKYIAGFLVCICVICYLVFFYFRSDKSILRLFLVAMGLLLLVPLGIIFTEIYPLPVAFNMYLFRGDVFIRLIAFYIFIVFLDRRFNLNLDPGALRMTYAGLIVVSAALASLPGHLQLTIPENEIVRISRCIDSETPVDAFIIAPPDLKGVRFYSRRSVFASWKAHGLFLMPPIATEWYRRMQLLCGLNSNFSCLGKKCRKLCGKNFDNFSPEYLMGMAEHYNADYLLLRKNKALPLPEICSTEHFVVYKIQ